MTKWRCEVRELIPIAVDTNRYKQTVEELAEIIYILGSQLDQTRPKPFPMDKEFTDHSLRQRLKEVRN